MAIALENSDLREARGLFCWPATHRWFKFQGKHGSTPWFIDDKINITLKRTMLSSNVCFIFLYIPLYPWIHCKLTINPIWVALCRSPVALCSRRCPASPGQPRQGCRANLEDCHWIALKSFKKRTCSTKRTPSSVGFTIGLTSKSWEIWLAKPAFPSKSLKNQTWHLSILWTKAFPVFSIYHHEKKYTIFIPYTAHQEFEECSYFSRECQPWIDKPQTAV